MEGAIYKRADGIVVWDKSKCTGADCAKECVQGCPYSSAFVNPVSQTFEKCDYCVHRVDAGLQPACVATCLANVRIFGDVNDPNSEVFKLLANNRTNVLKPEEGTGPNTYYIALEGRSMKSLDGFQQLPIKDIENVDIVNYRG